MKRRVLKTVALLCVVLMVSSISGCSNSKNVEQTNQRQEPITLKVDVVNDNVSFSAGVQDDLVAKEIEKQTGVRMDIENITQDYSNKISVALAANDLADITIMTNVDQRNQAIKSNNILDITDLVDKYAPNFSNDSIGKLRIAWMKEFTSDDTGRLYFFNGPGDDSLSMYEPITGNYVRADLWKEMGYPEFSTIDDLLPLLKKMQDMAGRAKDGSKPYALGGWFADSKGWAEWPIGVMAMDKYRIIKNVLLEWQNGNIVGSILDPNCPNMVSMRWWNKAYRMGILDPESATMKYDQFLEKVKSGKILHVFGSWMKEDANAAFAKNGEPDKGFMPLPLPSNFTQLELRSESVCGQNYIAISSNCEYPEKAVGFLDYLYSWDGAQLILNGIKGTHWDVVDGKPQWKDEVIDSLLNDPSYKASTGIGKYCIALQLRGLNAIDPSYGVGIDLANQPKFLSARITQPFAKEFLEHYNAKTPMEMIFNQIGEENITPKFMMPRNETLTPPSGEYKKINDMVAEYIHNNVVMLIYAETEEDFNKFYDKWIADLKAMGIDKNIEFDKQDVSNAMKRIQEIINEANAN